jgi:hypothetical protein
MVKSTALLPRAHLVPSRTCRGVEAPRNAAGGVAVSKVGMSFVAALALLAFAMF